MNRRLIVVVLFVLTSVVLGATVFREQVGSAAPGIQDVFVTNSTREPVPVHEQGTADVNVANQTLAVHEQGTANVNVANTPLAVQVSGETPVQKRLEFVFGQSEAEAHYTVPAGKYLRIEYVTFDFVQTGVPLNMPDIRWFRVFTTVAGATANHYLRVTTQGAREIVSEPVTIYAQPGSTVDFEIRLAISVGTAGPFDGSFSGVLIDAP
jgi:hypothetical protein